MFKSSLKQHKVVCSILLLLVSSFAYSVTLNLTTKYGQTGGLRGNLNSIGNQVNGQAICTQNNTNANIEPGCDMFSDPGYVAGGNTPVDDSYTGDLVVRTNDNFELIAAWAWTLDVGETFPDEITLTSTLPAGTNFIFDGIPGSCDAILSTLSADGKTISCVRTGFDTNGVGSYAEDLAFAVRVEGDALNGDTPGPLSISITDTVGTGPVVDGTEATSLVITAAPRWNIDKSPAFGHYITQAGQQDDLGNAGWYVWYNFSIEVDEVTGETDSPINPALGNEALFGGTNATVTFTDDLSGVSPNARLVTWENSSAFTPINNACDMDSNYSNGNEPFTVFNAANPERSIQAAPGVMNVTCTQTGTSVAVTVTGIDGTLTNAPTHNRVGGLLPVNRNIAAIGVMRVFVPLSDVVAAGGSLVTENCVTDFDPDGMSGGSNFGINTESEMDNCRSLTLHASAGSWDKNYRKGWSDRAAEALKWGGGGWWFPPTDASLVESGDGFVTSNGVWGTYTTFVNTGGSPFTNLTLCDVIDTETYEMTIIDPANDYATAGTGVFDQTIHAVDLLHDNTETNAGLSIEYATGYVGSWPPDPLVAPSTAPTDEVVDECSDPGITWYPDLVTAEATDGAPVSKVRISVPSLIAGNRMTMRIKHTARTSFLTSGLPIPNDQLLINHASYTRDGLTGTVGGDGRTWRAGDYIALDASQSPPNGGGGDRLIMVAAKVRVLKDMTPGTVSIGDTVTVTLSPSLTSDSSLPVAGTIVIADLLPEGMNYNFGSTTGTFGSVPTAYGEPTILSPTTDALCNLHVADVVAEGFPCGDTLNGGASGTTILVWDLGMQQSGLVMDDLVFNTVIAIDAAPTVLQNYVQISSTADSSPSSQRVANANVSNSVPSSLLIVKSVLTPLNEINSTTAANNWMDFQIGLRNGAAVIVESLDFIDILPFNGDGVSGSFTFTPAPGTTVPRNRVPASNFSGTLEFDSVSFDDNGGACDTTTLQYWYTRNAGPLDISPRNTTLNDTTTGTSNWCQGTAAGPGGCDGGDGAISNADVTAFRIIGPDFAASATCFVNVTYATAGANVDADIYSNTAGAEVQGVTNAVLSNTVSAEVFAGSIGDLIWNDINNDGIYDAGEELAGIPVTLTPPAGVDLGAGDGVAVMTVTDANGNYLFENLPAGVYTVTVDDSSINGVNTVDPDTANPGDSTSSLTLGANEDNLDQDFGYFAPGSIGDTIFNDLNNDGVVDAGEGVAGVTVTLTPPAGIDLGNGPGQPITTVTDGNGNYNFPNLPNGDYVVVVDESTLPVNLQGNNTQDPDGGLDSTSNVALGIGENNDAQDFGYFAPGSIGDTIFNDLDGNGNVDAGEELSGVTVILTPPANIDLGAGLGQPITTVTNGTGNYNFPNLPPGDYTVVVDESTLPANLQGGNSVDPDGGNDSTSQVTLAGGENNDMQDFGYVELGSIGDTIYNDLNNDGVIDAGEGIAGVTVILTPPAGIDLGNGPGQPITTVTDGNGNYSFPSLPPGDYTIAVDETTLPPALQGDNTQDPDGGLDSSSIVTLALGENNDVQDFGYFDPGNIGDTIWHDANNDGNVDAGEALAGVTVSLTPPAGIDIGAGPGQPITTVTDANGNYNFSDLPAGNYTVVVDESTLPVNLQGNNTQDPDGGLDSTSNVTLPAGGSNLDQDFGYFAPGSIGDTIYDDLDNDGVVDVGEGLAGVTVILTPPVGIDLGNGPGVAITTVTDGNGNYTFPNLPPGEYTVAVDESTLPPGLQGNNTQDPDGTTDSSSTITLNEGEDNDSQDFGYFNPGNIGDTVWFDADNDGNVDPGEGIAGVTVTLTPPAGIDIGAGVGQPVTTVTDGNGNYIFEGLPPGDYTVTIDESTLPVVLQGNNTQDPDSGNDSTSVVTLLEGGSDLEQDFGYYVPATLELAKTVYLGHDNGAGCPGVEILQGVANSEITYCFTVTNTGQTYMDAVAITDTDISVTQGDLSNVSGTLPLAPGASITYYYNATLVADLVNTAQATANPVDSDGVDLPGGIDPIVTDTAEVDLSGAAVSLVKTVYINHDSGLSCAGTNSVNIFDDTSVTYCFVVTNTGDAYLDDFVLNDATLGINQTNMTLLNGTFPVAPNASAVYYYETTVADNVVNTAEVDANPVDSAGNDIPGLPNVSDTDTATIDLLAPEMTLEKTVYLGHDNALSCPGNANVTLSNNGNVTFCFTVTNTGDVDLADVAINDVTLGVTDTSMTLVSGASPLTPGQTMVWAYETTLTQSINNIAQVTANPVDDMGNDIPGLIDEEAESNATVNATVMIPTLNMFSILLMITLMLMFVRRRYQVR
ncbi:internalin, putative [hydrothermal vent metagenome]|uniref:Internalin, putative n=1 Tax=hydrothermal vent metagenome TaxID=652676 RepID=A0A3B0V7I1_9ZZZZ